MLYATRTLPFKWSACPLATERNDNDEVGSEGSAEREGKLLIKKGSRDGHLVAGAGASGYVMLPLPAPLRPP